MKQLRAPEILRKWPRLRQGSTATEVLVAATLLLSLIGAVIPTTVRTAKIWRDTRHFQIATNELSNQLEALSSLNEAERATALNQLTVSEPTRKILMGATIASETANDSDGNRITLTLNWERTPNANPVKITGWLKAASSKPSAPEEPANVALEETSDEAK